MRFTLSIELDANNWGRIHAVLHTLANDLTYFPASREVEVDHGSVSGPEGTLVGKWEVIDTSTEAVRARIVAEDGPFA